MKNIHIHIKIIKIEEENIILSCKQYYYIFMIN
jgi:hypothetical protein